MDYGKTNSKVRDFDLNIAYVEEDFDLNAENEFHPSLIPMDTQQPSHDIIENMNMEDAKKLENEVLQSSEVDTVPMQANSAAGATSEVARVSFAQKMKMNMEDADKRDNEVHQSSKMDTSHTTIQANSGAGATSAEEKHDEPKYITSASFAPGKITPQRRRRRPGGEVQRSKDSEIFCTNYFCRTKETPMWRKGPLGPRTLCNACGLQYVKMVRGKDSGKPAAVPGEGDASTAHHDGASPDPVPAPNL